MGAGLFALLDLSFWNIKQDNGCSALQSGIRYCCEKAAPYILGSAVGRHISAEGGNVMVTCWERDQTGNIPVARISTDNGATFGPVLVLAANGTLCETEKRRGMKQRKDRS